MKKILTLVSLTLFLNACSFLGLNKLKNSPIAEVEAKLSEDYKVIADEYFKMLEDPIKEKDRLILLKKFDKYKNNVIYLKNNRANIDKKESEIFNSFINKASINIQYLNDLAD